MVLEFPVMADYALLAIDGITIYATHGHVYHENHLPPMQKGDVLLHGHTHVLRADRCISGWSMEARVPFGDLDFVEYVMSVDPALKVNRCGKGKYLLRRAFQSDALLPDEILWREKAAFSDAVGHSMVDDLKEYARAQYSDLAFTRGCAQYQYRPPFTRESLLYRDLFERYYPGQARMIKDFWMPNRAWEGCNVDDPSARALKNYGASGF